jgi:lipoate-protein ligase A
VARAWRLLRHGAAAGPWNMGVDEALLASVAAGGDPTLRFYTWDGPWLSLGYAQRSGPERLAACEGAGVGVVRRPTGGRAVLHGGDLTYALAAPAALLPAGLGASYRLVAGALLAALRSLGVAAERSGPGAPDPERGAFDCFERAAPEEVCVVGRKLSGSAQRRTRSAVLQHGSIRVVPDPPGARRAAGLAEGAATSLRELGTAADFDALRERCIEAFTAALGARLERGALTPAECGWAAFRREQHAKDPLFAPVAGTCAVPRGISRVVSADR